MEYIAKLPRWKLMKTSILHVNNHVDVEIDSDSDGEYEAIDFIVNFILIYVLILIYIHPLWKSMKIVRANVLK